MKPIRYQHELTEELENRSGVKGLKLIRLKGSVPSWDLGKIREPTIDPAKEAKLHQCLAEMQREFDIA
jgi:hypothetical protein